ncbi:hypothetical protein DFH09DRAFT_1103924 [Mycena vulgaris]|nr:hypothetical protein DFH09DRAFT_1103924 [Mycena vulgaris]
MTAAFHLTPAPSAVFGAKQKLVVPLLVLSTHSKKLKLAVAGSAALKGQPHVSLINPAVLPTLAQQTVRAVTYKKNDGSGVGSAIIDIPENPPVMVPEYPGRKSPASQPDGVGNAAENDEDVVGMPEGQGFLMWVPSDW